MSDGKVEIAALTTPALCTADERETRFREFVARDLVRAHRLAWRLVGGDDAAAEDVVQDALVRAWRALPRFRGEAKLSTAARAPWRPPPSKDSMTDLGYWRVKLRSMGCSSTQASTIPRSLGAPSCAETEPAKSVMSVSSFRAASMAMGCHCPKRS